MAEEDDEPESAEEMALEKVTPGAEEAESEQPENGGESGNEKPEHGMSIPLPEGFQPPQGTKDGDTFEVITKAKIKDGRLVFESFDGQPVGSGSEDPDESDVAAEETLRQAVKAGGLRG